MVFMGMVEKMLDGLSILISKGNKGTAIISQVQEAIRGNIDNLELALKVDHKYSVLKPSIARLEESIQEQDFYSLFCFIQKAVNLSIKLNAKKLEGIKIGINTKSRMEDLYLEYPIIKVIMPPKNYDCITQQEYASIFKSFSIIIKASELFINAKETLDLDEDTYNTYYCPEIELSTGYKKLFEACQAWLIDYKPLLAKLAQEAWPSILAFTTTLTNAVVGTYNHFLNQEDGYKPTFQKPKKSWELNEGSFYTHQKSDMELGRQIQELLESAQEWATNYKAIAILYRTWEIKYIVKDIATQAYDHFQEYKQALEDPADSIFLSQQED